MKGPIIRLLDEVDRSIAEDGLCDGRQIELILIGGAAISLMIERATTTKDIDVYGRYETDDLAAISRRFGRRTAASVQFDLFIERVGDFAALPPGFERRAIPFEPDRWRRLRIRLATPMDILISKLKPFRTSDRRDIREILDQIPNAVDVELLTKYFDDTVWYFHDEEDVLRDRLDRVLAYISGASRTI